MHIILNTKTGEPVTVEVEEGERVAGFHSESAAFTYIEAMADCAEDGADDCVPYWMPDALVEMLDD
jgi:hypothetical protein